MPDTVWQIRERILYMDNEVMIPKDLIGQIREIMNTARYNVAREVNNEQILAYWNNTFPIYRTIEAHPTG